MVTLITETPAFTVTAAVPENPAPTEIRVMSSLEAASTVTLPRTVSALSLPMIAFVVLLSTITSTPAPTPALPPMASAPAMSRISVVSLAYTFGRLAGERAGLAGVDASSRCPAGPGCGGW